MQLQLRCVSADFTDRNDPTFMGDAGEPDKSMDFQGLRHWWRHWVGLGSRCPRSPVSSCCFGNSPRSVLEPRSRSPPPPWHRGHPRRLPPYREGARDRARGAWNCSATLATVATWHLVSHKRSSAYGSHLAHALDQARKKRGKASGYVSHFLQLWCRRAGSETATPRFSGAEFLGNYQRNSTAILVNACSRWSYGRPSHISQQFSGKEIRNLKHS